MADISWSAEARRDLKAIADYYKVSSPEFAKYIVDQLFHAVSRLEHFPKIGRKVPELEMDIFRERVVEEYRIIYLLQGSSIEILTIIHSRQNLLKHLKEIE